MNRTSLNTGTTVTFAERPGLEFNIKKEIGRGSSCIVYHAICSDNTEHLLKEYYPKALEIERSEENQVMVPGDKNETFRDGLLRFQSGCDRQKDIRQSYDDLKNFTCNVQGYYKANGTEYIDMTCFNGQTYNYVKEKSIYNLMIRMRTLAQVVGNYHKAGLLHLDIKPENIYVRPENETVEDVMLFDFDSVTPIQELLSAKALSCTLTWAAPEQLLHEKRNKICPATDLFAIGEIIFVQLFGRHSTNAERRSFVTKYDYNYDAEIFRDMNPKVYPLLNELLSHTICGVVSKRYQAAEQLVNKLDDIIKIADPKEPYLKSSLPAVQNFFIGRDKEISEIHEKLNVNNILLLNGIGGIGKSELAKNYAKRYKDNGYYDTVIFAPYVSDINMLLQDDSYIPLYNFAPYPEEKPEDYANRKLRKIHELCDKRTLFILDNLDNDEDSNLNKIFDLDCHILVTTRMDLTDYGYGGQLYLDALYHRDDIFQIFFKHYTKSLTQEERTCVEKIIDFVAGHTMTVELLAKQMLSGRIRANDMLTKLQEGTLRNGTKEKVRIGKDGIILSQNIYVYLKTLFDLSVLEENEKHILINLSLIPYTGISTQLFYNYCELEDFNSINSLIVDGWIKWDKERDYIALHPVICQCISDIFLLNVISTFLLNLGNDIIDYRSGTINIEMASQCNSYICIIRNVLGIIRKQHVIDTNILHCMLRLSRFQIEVGDFSNLYENIEIFNLALSNDIYIDDSLKVDIYNLMAIFYDKYGNFIEDEDLILKAVEYYKKCIDIICLEGYEPKSDLAIVYNNIGVAYLNMKRLLEAETIFLTALNNLLPDDFSGNYLVNYSLGVTYYRMHKYEDAWKYYDEAEKNAIYVGDFNIALADVYYEKALCSLKMNKLDEAWNHCHKALSIQENSLSETVPDLIMSKNLLAVIMMEYDTPEHNKCALDLFTEIKRIYDLNYANQQTETYVLLIERIEMLTERIKSNKDGD